MAKVLNSNLKIVEQFYNKLPKFLDGRIDYRNSRESAVINVFIMHEERLLLLKRSDKVGNYKGCWNVVAGYFDELKSVLEKALEEVGEETGIGRDQILNIKVCEDFKLIDKEIDKIFYIFPVLITLKSKPEIKLDREHTECRWVDPNELSKFKTVNGLHTVFKFVTNKY